MTALAPGTRFGPYELIEPIGSGGMGDVYRAADTVLKRDVALKVLPPAFAGSAERVARFQREAEALAALNHPNIAQVYGLEQAGESTAIVMELVAGPTLGERIALGPVPYDEALGIAMQIAAALEAAHGRGIVHRDLKPANVKVRADGAVKVLDFGIATAPESAAGASGRSPTRLTPAFTETGVLLGTAGYMSPEQARGRTVDERADIWAFGCVLYEMLTGQPAFGGEDVTTTLARVLEREANLGSLPAAVPPAARQTITLCLAKDPSRRIADIRDVRLALEGRFESLASPTHRDGARAPAWRRALVPAAALVAGAALAGLAAWSLRPVEDRPVTRFSVDLAGPMASFDSVALSPNGRRIVYAANGQLYLHRLDQTQPTPIPGTEDGRDPFFSPDGESVAFFTTTELKVAGFSGEPPRAIADLRAPAAGISGVWDRANRIHFGRTGAFGLSSVPAVGGEPEPFAELAGYADLDYPDVLPGGEWMLASASKAVGVWSDGDIVALHIETGARDIVMTGGHFARYLPTGHLVFARNGTLYAVRFDPATRAVQGAAVPVVQGIATDETSGHAKYAVAANGTLVYMPGAAGTGLQLSLVQFGRDGSARPLPAEARQYNLPRVSPDGTRLAVEVRDGDGRRNVWIVELASGIGTQLTFEGMQNRYPVWMPDGREILFSSDRAGAPAVYRAAADGTGEAIRVVEGTEALAATHVLPGNVLVYQDRGETGGRDILTLDLEAGGPPIPFLATPADERDARGSPSGAWIAYVSDESNPGAPSVYARRYPRAPGGPRPISTRGAAPVWSADGDSITFIGPPPGPFMSVPIVSTADTLNVGRPEMLFQFGGRFPITDILTTAPYDVMPNGEGFIATQFAGTIATERAETAIPERLVVVLNWFEELERLVAN